MQGRGRQESAESSSAGWSAAVLAAIMLSGCARPPRRAPPPPPISETGTGCEHVDARHSDLRVLVYRAGPLARLGHNHVLQARDMDGVLCGRRFALSIPVEGLVIDAPEARAEEGEEFASTPSAADVEGTRRHLRGPDQLDAAGWPVIRVTGTLATEAGATTAHLRLTVRGHDAELALPVAVGRDGSGGSVVAGGLELRQTALGIAPYQVALGALQVRDAVAIRFRLVAERPAVPAGTESIKPMDPGG